MWEKSKEEIVFSNVQEDGYRVIKQTDGWFVIDEIPKYGGKPQRNDRNLFSSMVEAIQWAENNLL